MPYPTLEGVAAVSTNNGTSHAITLPADVADGDIVLVFLEYK